MTSKIYRLCYIANNFAYFTSQFDKVWGDDWDDAPYELNAEPPYDEFDIVKIAYEGAFDIPCDAGHIVSVQDINRKKVPWLQFISYNRHAYKLDGTSIWAGTTLDEFKQLIKQADGVIYERSE